MLKPNRNIHFTLEDLKVVQRILQQVDSSSTVSLDILLWKLGHQITACTPKPMLKPKLVTKVKCKYDMRNGSPFDRGLADAFYGHANKPHYYKGQTRVSDRVEIAGMTLQDIAAYNAGYCETMSGTEFKDWGND